MKAEREAREGRTPRSAPGATHVRFSTRRRLVAAFAAVLGVFLCALAFQIVGLWRMEATFEAMKAHEEQMRIALLLEDAVRDQYGHAGRFAIGENLDLAAYEEARGRAVELGAVLSRLVAEPESVAWMREIGEASRELDRMFREQIAPAAHERDPHAALAHERSYPLVSRIEQNVDSIFARLQGATTAFRRDLVEAQVRALRWTAALLVATPILVAAAVLYLARSIARPLARLSEGAAALARGELDTRIDVDTPDEFGALAAEFNEMTIALKQNQERLVASEKLAGVGRLAAGVAHELNNPLQVMLGYLSLNRDHPDRRLAAQLSLVEDEALRCKGIVDGLLELSRPAVSSLPVDLRALCENVAGALRVSMSAPLARLQVGGDALALGESAKLRQVVFNLMKNALEAAGPTGEVDVNIRVRGTDAEIVVRDDGPGVPSEARPKLFEPFFTTKPGGRGLGLAVSRAVALAHGGDVALEPASGRGAAFTLRLPAAPAGERS
jgi:signal transduction histidine kinase